MGNKANWEGVAISDENMVTAEGGFRTGESGAGTGIDIGASSKIYEETDDNLRILANSSIELGTAGNVVIDGLSGMVIKNLPTTNPGGSNIIWSDSGTLKVT
jgi:hypothetical protein